MILLRPKRWTEKPPVGAQIDWGHPLARNLRALILMNERGGVPQDLTTREPGMITGSVVWATGHPGAILSSAGGAGTDYLTFADRARYSVTSGPMTLAMRMTRTAGGRIDKYAALGSNGEYVFGFNAGTTDLYGFLADDSASAYIGRSRLGLTADNSWRTYTLTYDGGTTNASVRLYEDGVQIDTANFGAGAFVAMEDGTRELSINRNNPGLGNAGAASFAWVRMHAAWLSPSEVQWLHHEPYAMLRPHAPTIRYFFPSVAGGAINDLRASWLLMDWVVGRVLPAPDGTISTADRLQLVGKYRGIAASSPGAAAGVYIPILRRRRR